MRVNPLSREEKSELERLLSKLKILPPSAGHVMLSIDSQGKVGSVESKAVWR